MNIKELNKFSQYRKDIFTKLNFDFEKGKKILDLGCGDGADSEVFKNVYELEVWGTDIYEEEGVKNILGDRFTLNPAGIFNLTYDDNEFDYVFLHDVLHHIDEENQSYEKHIQGLKNLKRIVKPGGFIVIVEGNRYNPLFYPHMVKMLKHEHFKQVYFKKIVTDVYSEDVDFRFFECHYYPQSQLWFWKIYEKIMETFSPKSFLAYNVAIIKNEQN